MKGMKEFLKMVEQNTVEKEIKKALRAENSATPIPPEDSSVNTLQKSNDKVTHLLFV